MLSIRPGARPRRARRRGGTPPDALSYLVKKVNERLHAFGKEQDGIHHGIERELRQVEDELQHIERAILV
jgi:hypothetical protein